MIVVMGEIKGRKKATHKAYMVPFNQGMRIPQVSIQEGLSVVTYCKLQLLLCKVMSLVTQ
jgi:hypothetical protein